MKLQFGYLTTGMFWAEVLCKRCATFYLAGLIREELCDRCNAKLQAVAELMKTHDS